MNINNADVQQTVKTVLMACMLREVATELQNFNGNTDQRPCKTKNAKHSRCRHLRKKGETLSRNQVVM